VANVKVTPDGVVKLLDFGLAKAFSDQPDTIVSDPENSPTLTLGATVAGTVLGTAAYMAPEQAKGRKVDKRADIWSWGVVLYELLTGERMFQGEDTAETLAAVIHKHPDLERVPPQVRKLLRSCVEKDPKKRLRDIGDAWQLLEEPASATIPSRYRLARVLAVAVLALICFALAFVAWEYFRLEPPHVAKLYFPPPEKGTLLPDRFPTLAVSPDGRRFVFEAGVDVKRGLWERDLDNPVPRLLSEFELGNRPETPFWAPDSRRLAFFQAQNHRRHWRPCDRDRQAGLPSSGNRLLESGRRYRLQSADFARFVEGPRWRRISEGGYGVGSITQRNGARLALVSSRRSPFFVPGVFNGCSKGRCLRG
jgi:serine/threonine protein kinase